MSALNAARSFAAAASLGGLVVITACASPDADASAYRQSSVAALQATLSETRTAELAARLWLDGSSTLAVARVLVHGNDKGVASEQSWFAALQPPGRAGDHVRSHTLDAIDTAGSAVSETRIALSRADRGATVTAVHHLAQAGAELEALTEGAP